MQPELPDESETRPPDWVIDFSVPPIRLPAEVVSRLADIEELSAAYAAQERAAMRLGQAMARKVDEALAAGIPARTIADHSNIRPEPLENYYAGTHPLYPGGPLYDPTAITEAD